MTANVTGSGWTAAPDGAPHGPLHACLDDAVAAPSVFLSLRNRTFFTTGLRRVRTTAAGPRPHTVDVGIADQLFVTRFDVSIGFHRYEAWGSG